MRLFLITTTLSLPLATSLIFNTLYNTKSLFLLIAGVLLISLISIHKKAKIPVVLLISITGFLITSWISYQTSSIPTLGLPEITMDFTLWILFLLIFAFPSKKAFPHKFLFPIIITATAFLSIFGLWQILARDELRIASTFFNWYDIREYFPNAFALFLLLTTPLIFQLKNKYLSLSLLALNSFALFNTFSRGAFLAFIAQISLLLLFFFYQNSQSSKIKKLKFPLSILTTLFITFIIFSYTITPTQQSLTEKYTFQGTEQITSLNERSQFFKGTLKLINSSPTPLTGYGPDTFNYIYPQIQPLFLANAPHPHNWFLKLALERGIPNLLFFAIVIIYTYFTSLRFIFSSTFKKLSKHKQPLFFTTLVALTGALLHNLIDFNLNFVSTYLIFIFLLSFLYFQLKTSSYKPLKTINFPVFLLIPLLLIPATPYIQNELIVREANSLLSETSHKITISAEFLTKLSHLNYKNSNHLLKDFHLFQENYSAMPSALLQQVIVNPYDAVAYNQLGNLATTSSKKLEFYQKAIQADPKNNWIYYTNYYQLASKDIIQEDTSKILKLLLEYQQLAQQNIHFTALHDNIEQAQKLALIFYNNTQNTKFQEVQENLHSYQEYFQSNLQ